MVEGWHCRLIIRTSLFCSAKGNLANANAFIDTSRGPSGAYCPDLRMQQHAGRGLKCAIRCAPRLRPVGCKLRELHCRSPLKHAHVRTSEADYGSLRVTVSASTPPPYSRESPPRS